MRVEHTQVVYGRAAAEDRIVAEFHFVRRTIAAAFTNLLIKIAKLKVAEAMLDWIADQIMAIVAFAPACWRPTRFFHQISKRNARAHGIAPLSRQTSMVCFRMRIQQELPPGGDYIREGLI
jgi:hypothetical protein